MFYLAGYLAERGFRVTVISPAYVTNRKKTDIRDQKYTNIYLGTIKRTVSHGQAPMISGPDHFLRKVKRQISTIMNQIGEWVYGEQDVAEIHRKKKWVRKYRDRICQIINEEKADKVIISMPSFSFVKLGKRINNECASVKLIYDYRDPWYLWNHKRNPAYYCERYYLKYADCIVGFSERFCNDMIKEMKIAPDRVYTVYNGYSEKSWQKFEKSREEASAAIAMLPQNKMIITYTGSMSLTDKKGNYRNPANLIAAVRNQQDIELYLVGISKIDRKMEEENVHFIGEVTQQQSFAYMDQSDVLISIHDAPDCSGNYLISGKFYDYMRSGKIILQIGSSDGLMAEFVNKFDLGVVCENQVDKLRDVIMTLHKEWKVGRLIRKTDAGQDIRRFEREVQNETYRQIIEGL